MSDAGVAPTSALGLASGRYALPATGTPTQLVVMFHGNHNDSCSWRNHLRQAASRGAIAIAMDYTGQRTQDGTANWGWFVNEGATDSIAAAKYFIAKYPSITQVFAFGVSMGGNASGMAVASKDAVRADGSALFDYWVDVEGVNNLIEEYTIIRPLAPFVPAAAVAQNEIEEEAGGPIEKKRGAYLQLTNIARVNDMMTNGLKGAIVVNGVDDGLVSTSQSPEMAAALNAAGIPAHLFTVLLRGDGESGTTATGSFLFGPGAPAEAVYDTTGNGDYESPLAGHGWEGSDTQLVIATGLDQLWLLMTGKDVSPGETVVSSGSEIPATF
jgi:dipeptidyl aminopeptidase/acylaminoacyl peptidase